MAVIQRYFKKNINVQINNLGLTSEVDSELF